MTPSRILALRERPTSPAIEAANMVLSGLAAMVEAPRVEPVTGYGTDWSERYYEVERRQVRR